MTCGTVGTIRTRGPRIHSGEEAPSEDGENVQVKNSGGILGKMSAVVDSETKLSDNCQFGTDGMTLFSQPVCRITQAPEILVGMGQNFPGSPDPRR